MIRYYTMYMNQAGDGQGGAAGAGGAPAGGQQGGQGQQGNGNAGGTQEGENFSRDFSQFWVPSATLDGSAAQNAAGTPAQQQPATQPAAQQQGGQPAQPPAQQPTMEDFIAGLRLTDGLDLATIHTELGEGKTDALNAAFNHVAANVFQQSMVHANRLMDTKISKAVEDAVSKSTGKVQSGLAVRELNDKFEFTKNPGIAPIAEAALANVMKKNPDLSVSDAVERTGKFFQEMMKEVQTNAPSDFIPPASGPGGQPFAGAGTQQQGNAPDWLELFGQSENTGS